NLATGLTNPRIRTPVTFRGCDGIVIVVGLTIAVAGSSVLIAVLNSFLLWVDERASHVTCWGRAQGHCSGAARVYRVLRYGGSAGLGRNSQSAREPRYSLSKLPYSKRVDADSSRSRIRPQPDALPFARHAPVRHLRSVPHKTRVQQRWTAL